LAFHSRLLILTPSIIPSLSLPFHAIQTATVAALTAYTTTLAAELAPADIPVIHLRLGTFDCGAVGGRTHLQASRERTTRADVLSWSSAVRATYAKNFVAQSNNSLTARGCINTANGGGVVKGSSLRELHNAVFDALTVKKPAKEWHVGSGSLLYAVVGNWVPAGMVGWMIGLRNSGVVKEEMSGDESAAPEGSVEWERVERMV